jgi:hypothetical protein
MLFLPSVLEILQSSVRMYRKHAALFLGYASWLFLPILLLLCIELFALEGFVSDIAIILIGALEFLLSLWVGIVLIRATSVLSLDQIPDPHKISLHAWRVIWPLFLVALLQGLIVFGGLVLLIVPGILFLVWYSFSQFAVILENKQGLDALAWSKSIVEGHFWRVLWKLFGGPLIIMLVYSVLIGMVISIIALVIDYDLTAFLAQTEIPVWVNIIDRTTQVFLLPLYLIYTTLVYKLFLTVKHADKLKKAKKKKV